MTNMVAVTCTNCGDVEYYDRRDPDDRPVTVGEEAFCGTSCSLTWRMAHGDLPERLEALRETLDSFPHVAAIDLISVTIMGPHDDAHTLIGSPVDFDDMAIVLEGDGQEGRVYWDTITAFHVVSEVST